MPDPTEPVIIASFFAALGLFAVTALVRAWLGKKPVEVITMPVAVAEPVTEPLHGFVPLDEESPYQTPLTTPPPPLPVPVIRVPTSFYRPLDLLGMGFIFIVFFSLVVASVRASTKAELSLDPANLLTSIAFQFIIAGIVTAIVIARVRPIEWLGLKWPGWRWVFLIAPGTVIGMWLFFSGLQATGFMQWIESFGVEVV